MFDPEFKAKALEELRMIVREEVKTGVKEHIASQYPPLLKREDLSEIFQASSSVVTKLIKIPSFPKFPHVQGRYPRDQVLEWIEHNSGHESVGKGLRAI